MVDQFKSGRGGLRSPAGGRPKGEGEPKRTRSFKMTDTEHAKVREMLKQLRTQKGVSENDI